MSVPDRRDAELEELREFVHDMVLNLRSAAEELELALQRAERRFREYKERYEDD